MQIRNKLNWWRKIKRVLSKVENLIKGGNTHIFNFVVVENIIIDTESLLGRDRHASKVTFEILFSWQSTSQRDIKIAFYNPYKTFLSCNDAITILRKCYWNSRPEKKKNNCEYYGKFACFIGTSSCLVMKYFIHSET